MARGAIKVRQFLTNEEVIRAIRKEAKKVDSRVRYMDKTVGDTELKDYVHDLVDDKLEASKGFKIKDAQLYDYDELLNIYRDISYASNLGVTTSSGRKGYTNSFRYIKDELSKGKYDESQQKEFWDSLTMALEQFTTSHSQYKYDIVLAVYNAFSYAQKDKNFDISKMNDYISDIITESEKQSLDSRGKVNEKSFRKVFRDRLAFIDKL